MKALGGGEECVAKKLIRDEHVEPKPRYKGTVIKIMQYLMILIMCLGEFDIKHMIPNGDMRPEVPNLYGRPGIVKLPWIMGPRVGPRVMILGPRVGPRVVMWSRGHIGKMDR